MNINSGINVNIYCRNNSTPIQQSEQPSIVIGRCTIDQPRCVCKRHTSNGSHTDYAEPSRTTSFQSLKCRLKHIGSKLVERNKTF